MEHRRRLQDGISRIQKVAVVELGFRGAPGCFRGTWVYIGGRSRSVDARGAHEGGGSPSPRGRTAGLIRLQCIYNFLLFHAIILSVVDV